jgi:prephenate dehydratase
MASSRIGRPTVGFAGEPGSFAEDAALAYFDEPSAVALPSFRDVIEGVGRRSIDAGVVPIENIVNGTVREVYDLLLEADVRITGEVIVPVRLCLAALPGERMEDVERVYSHIQALGQAEQYLRQRPWTLLATTNTAGAGKQIADRRERASAAILSPRAAAVHGLEVLATDIQTEPGNRTRFLILATEGPPTGPDSGPERAPREHSTAAGGQAGAMRTTVVLAVRNEPGSLHRVLGVLAAHGLNMSKLESRPSRDRAWEYVFWVDIDGELCAPDAQPILEELREATAMLRVMGCYPRGEEPR